MSARADRLLERLDVMLRQLPSAAARRALLQELTNAWDERYRRWQRTDGASEWILPGSEPIDATDFTLTLSGLSERMRSVKA